MNNQFDHHEYVSKMVKELFGLDLHCPCFLLRHVFRTFRVDTTVSDMQSRNKHEISRNVGNCTLGYACSANIKISLRIRAVWSVLVVRLKTLYIHSHPK